MAWHATHKRLLSRCKECHRAKNRERAKNRTLAQRQTERQKLKSKQGKEYKTRAQINAHSLERKQNKIVEQNAKQAFDYWITEKATDQQVIAYFANAPWKNPRLTKSQAYKIRYNNDPKFNAKERMRRQINKAQKRDGVADLIRGAINRGGESSRVECLLGYTISDLMRHIEAGFSSGMTWQKFNQGLIHIDHIQPQCSFDLSDHSQWRRCWSLSNLQPLWWRDNLRKGGKLEA